MDNTNGWAKAGVMIREKMTPYSKFAAVYMTPENGVSFQYRPDEDGPCISITKPGVTTPQWVYLIRTATAFQAYHGPSKTGPWIDVNAPGSAPESVTMSFVDPNLYIGTVVTSHNAAELCTADFNDMTITPNPEVPVKLPWYRGNIGTNDREQLYVALEDTLDNVAVVYHDDPNAATLTSWQEWNIDLADFTGVDLDGIKKVYIGLGDRENPIEAGGKGTIYIDDIRACPPRCVPAFAQMSGDIARPYDCTVDEKDIRVMAGDWLLEDELIFTVPPREPNLLLHWSFDEGSGTTAYDSAGTTDGTIVGADWVSPDSNGAGYCLNFNGLGDYVQVPDGNDANSLLNGLGGLTVSIWVKSDVTNTNKGFIICEQPEGGDDSITIRYDSDGADWDGENLLKMGITTTGGEQQLETSSNTQTTDWQHLVMTWSSGQVVRFYIDGLEDTPTGTDPNTTGTITGVTELIVGKGGKDENADQGWDGLIDDVRIYDYPLSDKEVLYLANDGAPKVHYPIVSDADLYDGEAPGNQWINFKDYALIADQYLEIMLWP